MPFVLALLFLALSALPTAPAVMQPANPAAHHIEMDAKADSDSCSSVAVGQHTLLTAAHCVIGSGKITVDGTEATIVSTVYDEQDHVLIVVRDMTFPSWLQIDERPPADNERVRIWGWPGSSKTPVYREGFFKRVVSDDDGALYVWQLPIYPGDSGSGLISDAGKVIAVVSLGNRSAETATYALSFTADQIKAAQ